MLTRSRIATTLAPLCLLTLAVPPLWGQDATGQSVPPVIYGDKAPFQVVFDHGTGNIRVETPRGDTVDSWIADEQGRPIVAPLFAVPPDRPVIVRIENANPLLYNYSVQSETVREASIRPCTEIGRSFAREAVVSVLGALQGRDPTFAQRAEEYSKDISGNAFKDPSLLEGRSGEGMPRDEALLEDLVAASAPEAEAYLQVMEPFLTAARNIDDSLRVVARLADGQPAGPLLERLRTSLEDALPGISSPTHVPSALHKTITDYAPSVKSIVDAAALIEETRYAGAWASRAQELATRLAAVDVATLDAAALTFQDALHRIVLAERNVTQTHVTGANPDYRRIRIELTRTSDYPELPRYRASVDLFTEPSLSLLCTLSIGFTFMDRPVEYATRGGAISRRESGDDLRTTASLMIHVGVPQVSFLSALVGAGIGTQGAPDFYIGGSLAVIQPLLVNAGWVYQRARQLPDGFALGDPVSQEFQSVEDFPKRFARTFFFGVSLRR